MSYIIVDQEWFSFYEQLKPVNLTREEWAIIIEYKEVFKKLLRKQVFNTQIDLMRWTYRWKEEQAYQGMEYLQKVIWEIDNIETKIKEYQEKERQKKT